MGWAGGRNRPKSAPVGPGDFDDVVAGTGEPRRVAVRLRVDRVALLALQLGFRVRRTCNQKRLKEQDSEKPSRHCQRVHRNIPQGTFSCIEDTMS